MTMSPPILASCPSLDCLLTCMERAKTSSLHPDSSFCFHRALGIQTISSLMDKTLLLTASLVSSAGTGAAGGTVTGARGHSVSLPAGITVAPDGDIVEWRWTSPKTRIAKYWNGNIKYYDTNYKGRVTLHRGNFSLEICDLRREDAGDYQVDVVTRTGSGTLAKVRLEVYEPVAGTHIQAQNITGICNFTLICSVTSGDPTSFRWWRGGEALRNDSTHHLRGHGETVEVHHTAEVGDVVYKCEARNPVSEGTAEIRLMDVCKQATPEPVAGTHIHAQYITGICNFTLTCSVTSGDPTSFRWWRGGEALRNDSPHHLRGHGETVEVHHTEEVGDVVYKCEARNPVSEGTAEIRLMDVCKQATPGQRRLTLKNIIIISVVATCVAVFIILLVCIIRRRRTVGGQRSRVTGGKYLIPSP
ncbi:HEPACAM family member 2-like [Rhinoraja longicauda]